ncbi:hypothetical protein PsorP6_017520 [Peronosclerospora sorghi]|uniref:Uncharacterized protein n=1 Tax=Peronosclerospora sorghi TaxID=230839 RepID=A0ACC0WN28_9STRA|nr:hypothetical protein PsorP6_017520 [Peronosclerospora sorghi]
MDLLFTQATEEQQKSTVVEDGGGNTSASDDEGDAGDEAKGSAAAGDVAVVGCSMTLEGTEDRIRRGIDSQEDMMEESKGDDVEREDEEKGGGVTVCIIGPGPSHLRLRAMFGILSPSTFMEG